MQTALLFKAPVSYQHEGQNRLQTVSQRGNGKTRKLYDRFRIKHKLADRPRIG